MIFQFLFTFFMLLYSSIAERCPYSKNQFIDTVTLGNIEESLQHPFIAAACHKEIEEDYEEALEKFYKSMKAGAEALRNIFKSLETQKLNHAHLAGVELQNLAAKLKEDYQLLKNSFQRGEFEKVKEYALIMKKHANYYYDEYLQYMAHFRNKSQKSEKKVKDTLHEYCDSVYKNIETVAEYFKKCLTTRIKETENYLNSLQN